MAVMPIVITVLSGLFVLYVARNIWVDRVELRSLFAVLTRPERVRFVVIHVVFMLFVLSLNAFAWWVHGYTEANS